MQQSHPADPAARSPALLSSRRQLLGTSVMAGAVILLGIAPRAVRAAAGPAPQVEIEAFAPSGKSLGKSKVAKIVRTEDEWRRFLAPESFEVTRHADTEAAYSGIYWNQHTDGLYRCICCNTALFDSRTKFESGTGWPSFYQPLSRDNLVESSDTGFGMMRTAVSCRRCNGHLGHVFDDGPKPTGLRYCMNSASLKFFPRVQA